MRVGKKINAIKTYREVTGASLADKLYRERTGMGLADAKMLVDRIELMMRASGF